MKRHRVRVVEEAETDLYEIYRHVARSDGAERAHHVLDRIEELCASLAELPDRGHVPLELERIGVTSFRELLWKPYRVVYEVVGREVYVHCVLDGRRDMQSLLERRLLR